MTTNHDGAAPDFSELDYSAQGLSQLWDDIQPLLAEHGSLCGDELADKLDARTYGYHDSSIRNGILPWMRDALETQGFISVTEVPGEDAKIVKKNWELHEEGDSQ
jgi:hypothetical protein